MCGIFTLYCSDGLPTMYSTTTMCVKQNVLFILYYSDTVKVLKVQCVNVMTE